MSEKQIANVGIVYKSGEIFHPNFVAQFRESLRTTISASLVNGDLEQTHKFTVAIMDIIRTELTNLTLHFGKEATKDGKQKLVDELKIKVGYQEPVR